MGKLKLLIKSTQYLKIFNSKVETNLKIVASSAALGDLLEQKVPFENKTTEPYPTQNGTLWDMRHDHFGITKVTMLKPKTKPFLQFLPLRDSMNIFMDANLQ